MSRPLPTPPPGPPPQDPAARRGSGGLREPRDLEERVLTSTVPVLLAFTADWCAPCRQMEPVVGELARELTDRALVLTVDVGEHPEVARAHGVTAVPCYLACTGGRETARLVGARPKAELRALLTPRT